MLTEKVKYTKPFIGAIAFTQSTQHLFFGREKEIIEILKKLEKTNLLFITGDKAIGKSSIAQAGVIPQYLKYNNRRGRTYYDVLEIKLSHNPFRELLKMIKKLSTNMNKEERYNEVFLGNTQMFKPIMVHSFLKHIFNNQKTKLLLYVDNMEELLILANSEEKQLFIETLSYLFQHQTEKFNVKIMITQRKKNTLFEYEQLNYLQSFDFYELKSLSKKGLYEAITKPLVLVGIAEKEAKNLADEIVDSLKNSPDRFLYLQTILKQTWCNRGKVKSLLDIYRWLGGIENVLENLVKDTFLDLKVDEIVLELIFLKLIDIQFPEYGDISFKDIITDRKKFSKDEWKIIQKLAFVSEKKGCCSGKLLRIIGEDDANQAVFLVYSELSTEWMLYVNWIKNEVNVKVFHEYKVKSYSEQYKLGANRRLRPYEETLKDKLLSERYRHLLSKDELSYLKNRKRKEVIKFLVWSTFGLVAVYYRYK